MCPFLHVHHIIFNFSSSPSTQASKVGINLIVLDDGWFGKRANDTCSLGDWVADLSKFPHGIKVYITFMSCLSSQDKYMRVQFSCAGILFHFSIIFLLLNCLQGLAEEVNAAGCKFGIWFEPEMVSEDSVRICLSYMRVCNFLLHVY